MNKQELLERYKDEDRLLISKVLDKINFVKTRNKIEYTDFLDMYQKKLCEKLLNEISEKNYIFYGGFNDSDKNMLIIYPEKIESIIKNNKFNFNKIMMAIKIILPNELKGTYAHKDYLSGLMKLGIKREKCGDILVKEDGAYIIITAELADYIVQSLKQLTRFSKSKIELINLEDIVLPEIKKEEITIIVPAMRLDSIISELAHVSRNAANDIIENQRVFVNYENEGRKSRLLGKNDVIVIRGKGKFKILNIEGNTKKGKIIVKVEHYI